MDSMKRNSRFSLLTGGTLGILDILAIFPC